MADIRLRDADLHWREIDGEVIALDGLSSTYVATNAAGAVLWCALVEGATHDVLVEALMRAFGIGRERAAADADRFLGQLAAQGLLARR